MEHKENKTIIHDTEKTDSWEQQTAMKVSGISILVNLLLSVFKLVAGIVAHSGAMISDAIHSASDVGSTVKTKAPTSRIAVFFFMIKSLL